jgi:cell division protein FtsA
MITVGVDLGNSKISCVVCDKKKDGKIQILSFVTRSTNNIKKSIITNLTKVNEEVQEIINQAANESHTEIASVYLNVPTIESKSIFSKSEINILNEKISDLHIKKTINQSDLLEPIDNYKVIHKSIINYELDKHSLILDPRGMYGNNLKVNFYKLAINENIIKTVLTIFDKLNIQIENYVPSPLSSALATLNDDEKELGSICIDLGAGSTSISVFENNKLIFIDGISIGGQNITNDLARGVSTTIESAERLKTLYGSVNTSPSDEFELIDVISLGSENNKFNQINRSIVNSIIKPRIEETLELIWQKLKDYNLHKKPIRNLVLTGGGSLLEGIEEYAQAIFNSKTRLASPKPIMGLPSKYKKPQFSQTIGLMLYEPKKFEIEFLSKKSEKIEKKSVFSRFSTWLDQYI